MLINTYEKMQSSDSLQVGRFSNIDPSVQIIFHKPGRISIGDYCNIGSGVKIICSGGDVKIEDWTTLHDNCLVLSTEYVNIGQHCWFGQNCVIDGTGGLKIGNGVRVGMYSQIWSHVAAGEQIEGCTLYGERPVQIEDDVWLVGSCIVASGVTIGRRTVALINTNITKSWPANSVLAGSPATLKLGLSFYNNIDLEEKWRLISQWLPICQQDLGLDLSATSSDLIEVMAKQLDGKIVFAKTKAAAEQVRSIQPKTTVCCIEDKSYNKQWSKLEARVLKYLAGNKARFYQRNY